MSWRKPPSSGWSGISIKNSRNWLHERHSDVIVRAADLEDLEGEPRERTLRTTRTSRVARRLKRRSRKAPVLDICSPHRPAADGSTEFLNAAALVHRDKGKIPKCRWIIDER